MKKKMKKKESPMEEKQPDTSLLNNIMLENNMNEDNNRHILSEIGISDYDSLLDHLPTINSIMKDT